MRRIITSLLLVGSMVTKRLDNHIRNTFVPTLKIY